jgi:hypothetical protein
VESLRCRALAGLSTQYAFHLAWHTLLRVDQNSLKTANGPPPNVTLVLETLSGLLCKYQLCTQRQFVKTNRDRREVFLIIKKTPAKGTAVLSSWATTRASVLEGLPGLSGAWVDSFYSVPLFVEAHS